MAALIEELGAAPPTTGKTSIAIEEAAAAPPGGRSTATAAAAKEETGAFSFAALGGASGAAAAFPLLAADRETRGLFEKWGMAPTNDFLSFRFDERFAPEKLGVFCADFFGAAEVRAALGMPPLSSAASSSSSSSSSSSGGALPRGAGCCTLVPTTQVRMDFFNRLREEGMVAGEAGRIRQCMPEYYDGVESGSMLREMALNEDSEHALVYDDDEKDEFLYRVFRHLIIGGGMCQPDESIEPYFRCTREIMKGLLTVKKVKSSGVDADGSASKAKVVVTSQVIAVDGTERDVPGLFPKDSPHNLCYLIVDPSKRRVVVWRNAWTSIW
jgi:hypothetical protein